MCFFIVVALPQDLHQVLTNVARGDQGVDTGDGVAQGLEGLNWWRGEGLNWWRGEGLN